MKQIFLLPCAGAMFLSACADSGANYSPILDGPETAAYQADLGACQALARNQKQFDQETMAATVLGAGAGAAIGKVEEDDALGGAIAGALVGGVATGLEAGEKREAIVIECLRGRGHRVVG